jgi:hypothetical protein
MQKPAEKAWFDTIINLSSLIVSLGGNRRMTRSVEVWRLLHIWIAGMFHKESFHSWSSPLFSPDKILRISGINVVLMSLVYLCVPLTCWINNVMEDFQNNVVTFYKIVSVETLMPRFQYFSVILNLSCSSYVEPITWRSQVFPRDPRILQSYLSMTKARSKVTGIPFYLITSSTFPIFFVENLLRSVCIGVVVFLVVLSVEWKPLVILVLKIPVNHCSELFKILLNCSKSWKRKLLLNYCLLLLVSHFP